MAGGMPLAFMQEDFLVLIFFGKFPVISLSGPPWGWGGGGVGGGVSKDRTT